MINYEGYRVYKSDSLVLLEKYANRNQSERFKARDQAALNLALSWNFGDVQRGYRHAKTWQSVPRVKVLTML
jgi:hypothetical protein